jgi:hypothetical protein
VAAVIARQTHLLASFYFLEESPRTAFGFSFHPIKKKKNKRRNDVCGLFSHNFSL